MSKAKNKVISGDYQGSTISSSRGNVSISSGVLKSIKLNQETVEKYELVDDKQKKSVSSAIVRGVVGRKVLGKVGTAAALTAKTNGIYQVAIVFKDGKRSLIEVDEKIYKDLTTSCFNLNNI